MDNVELLKKGYEAFAQGNIEAVLALFDPAIDWQQSKGMPTVSGDGHFTGHQAVVSEVFAKMPEYFDGFKIEIGELFGSGDRVVMRGWYTGTLKATGKPFKAAVVHLWKVRDDKATEYIQVADTAEVINPKA